MKPSPGRPTPLFPPRQRNRTQEQFREHVSVNKRSGRVEVRRLRATDLLNEYLDWPAVGQVCEIERTVTHADGRSSRERDYAITSVPAEVGETATLAAWWRGHWGIENRSHYVRDVTMGEDASRVRTGSAPQVLAAFRNAAIGWLRLCKTENIAEALRRNAAQVPRLLKDLGILKQ